MSRDCTNCIKLQAEIAILKEQIIKLQARIDSAGKYCQTNVDTAEKMLQAGGLGMRTYGRASATVDHLVHVAGLLGWPIGATTTAPPWRGFKGFRK